MSISKRYVSNADGKGWLMVEWDHTRTGFPPLPQFLRVDHEGVVNGRDRFLVTEGLMKGKRGSVRLNPANGSSYLIAGDPHHTGPAKVRLDLKSGRIFCGKLGPVEVVTMEEGDNPPGRGEYKLQIPYELHIHGRQYTYEINRTIMPIPHRGVSPFSETWFRIGSVGDRFLHPGRFTEGCITVSNIPQWTAVYNYLIKSRLGDGLNVGTVLVL